ncbi:MAG: hypothetical protein ACJAT2_001354 [Bacteriovoracaceae bacterium]|jgi:hypothetical protein
MNSKKDLLKNLFTEASAYTNMDSIEALVDGGQDLSQIPVQPLYLAVKALPLDKASLVLTKMSREQRRTCLDLDLWTKDNVDTEEFAFWIQAYATCPDEKVRQEFVGSTEFFLYLKSRFNIWTFDVEDPNYPDHDNYFLTDDNLLLVEFDADFPFVTEIQRFIRELYGERGVEGAYTYLFKLVSASYMDLMEEEYQEKKERLRDLGFVDYYDSLTVESTFANLSLLENFIRKKQPSTANLDSKIANQNLHGSAITSYKNKMDAFSDELGKITDAKRSAYVQYSFIRLVNSTLSFGQALKEGPIAMSRIGNRTKSLLELGFDYLLKEASEKGIYELDSEHCFFDHFDFIDIYQVGHSLVSIIQKPIKKALAKFEMEDQKEAFLGMVLMEILENAFSPPVKSSMGLDEEFLEINNFERYSYFKRNLILVEQLIPFSHGFYTQLKEMDEKGLIRDEFYLNYDIAGIDFESLLLTSLANFKLGDLDSDNKKLGLTPNEYKKFAKIFVARKQLREDHLIDEELKEFIEKFGLDKVDDILIYFKKLLDKHLSGYDFDTLPEEDFLHVGGPILLNLN